MYNESILNKHRHAFLSWNLLSFHVQNYDTVGIRDSRQVVNQKSRILSHVSNQPLINIFEHLIFAECWTGEAWHKNWITYVPVLKGA